MSGGPNSRSGALTHPAGPGDKPRRISVGALRSGSLRRLGNKPSTSTAGVVVSPVLTGPQAAALRPTPSAVSRTPAFGAARPPAKGDETPDKEPGYHVRHDHYRWFQQVLARTTAAGLGAFAGDGDTAAEYLTKRQGRAPGPDPPG